MIYALDSNTISYLLRDEGNIKENFSQKIIQQADNSYVIPPMAVFEINRWLLDKPIKIMRAYMREFSNLLQPVKNKAEISIDVWEKSADIYIMLKQKGQLIGDVDILIAAYCIINDYTLVTRNISDFKRIDNLNFVSWFE